MNIAAKWKATKQFLLCRLAAKLPGWKYRISYWYRPISGCIYRTIEISVKTDIGATLLTGMAPPSVRRRPFILYLWKRALFTVASYSEYRIYSNKTHDPTLAQEIQFWEFMGGSNLAQAATNFWGGWSNLAQYQEWSLSVVLVSLFSDNKGRSRAVSGKRATSIP